MGSVFRESEVGAGLTALRIDQAIVASSDATPGFVEALCLWLRELPALTSLSLVDCALHSAETAWSCRDGYSMLGPNVRRCQFAALAAAGPQLRHLDLTGNMLPRHDSCSSATEGAEGEVMEAVVAMLKALPHLETVRLGIHDGETSGEPGWTAAQIEAVRACLPAGCTLDADASTRWEMVLDDRGCGTWKEVPREL